MDMIFYGTGAAEGIPNPFCSCSICQNARNVQGKEIRGRTMFRINEKICIDMGADSFHQAIKYGDFVKLEHVIVTHTHEDHLNMMMTNVRNMAYVREKHPLHYYLTGKAFEMIDFYRDNKPLVKGMLRKFEEEKILVFHKLEYNLKYQIGELEVIPLKGNHFGNMDEFCANYLIKFPDGRKMYYGLDTGWYFPETFKALEREKLDLLISECTFGLTEGRGEHPDGHLDAFSCMKLFEKLLGQGTITPETNIVLAHINHYTSTHAQLVDYFKNQKFCCPITVAFDGYTVPF